MGGSSSRELRRGSKKKRMKEQLQRANQQEVLLPHHSTDSYNYSNTTHLGYDGHDTMTHMGNQDFSNHFDTSRNFFCENSFDQSNNNKSHNDDDDIVSKFGVNSENLIGSLQRPISANDKYEERQFRRPIRRHRSFNEHTYPGQGTLKEFSSSQLRCNSLNDLNYRGFLFEKQFMGNRFTNLSSFNLPMQYHPFDRSSPCNSSTYGAQSLIGDGGMKRYSCDSDSNSVSWDDGSNSACEDVLTFDSPVQPFVKRRQSDENQSDDCLWYDNRSRSENERSNSGLLFHTNTTSNSASISLPAEECGALDILSFPSEWSSCAVNKTGYVNISFSSTEGQSVQKFFQRTCKTKDTNLSISGIIRIENPFLHTMYLLKKEEMTVRYGHVDELFLYHGTKKRLVKNICEDNLNWRKYSEMHRFGKGVSFSPSATYSSHYSDDRGSDKVLLLFKVLVSNSVLGLPEMDIPLDDDGAPYDTSIKEDASVIVKYCDNEFYPLYKILYNNL